MTSHSSRQKVSGKRHPFQPPIFYKIWVKFSPSVHLKLISGANWSSRASTQSIFYNNFSRNRSKLCFEIFVRVFCFVWRPSWWASLLPIGRRFSPAVSASILFHCSYRVKIQKKLKSKFFGPNRQIRILGQNFKNSKI